MKRAAWTAVVTLSIVAALDAQGRSRWVYPDATGRLHYTADARGNRIMDFSHAGYKGGGARNCHRKPLPTPFSVCITISNE